MKLLTLGLLVGFLLGGWTALSAQQDRQPQPSLDAQYAAAKLKLAEANLAKVERMNQRVANAVAGSVVDDYRQDLALAQARVEQADGDPFEIWLREVQRAGQAADRAWRSAQAANDRTRGTIDPLDVERLRLRAEVLRINLERGKALASQPREVQLAWRISALQDDVEQLVETLRLSPPRRPAPTYIDPFYWGPR